MRENTTEKGLILVNKNSIVYKIQYFLSRIINRKRNEKLSLVASGKSTIIIPKEINLKATIIKEDTKDYFMKCIKNAEDDNARLLELQEQCRIGELKEKLLGDQIDTLCDLYNKQITNLKKLKEMNS